MNWRSAGRGIVKGVTNKVQGTVGAVANAGRAVGNVAQAGGDLLTGDLGGAGKNLVQAGGNAVNMVKDVSKATGISPIISAVSTMPSAIGTAVGALANTNRTTKTALRPDPLANTPTAAPSTPAEPAKPEVPVYKPQKSQADIEAEQQSAAQSIINNQNIGAMKQAPDTNVKRYNLSDFNAGPVNEQEQLYHDYITQGMKTGEFADVTSALNRTGRENALDTTRSQMVGEAQGAQAGYQPGTAEYNRAIALSTDGASERSMDRNNAINALQRGAVKDAMNAGKEIGQEGYKRSVDERTNAQGLDAIQYGQDRTGYLDNKNAIDDYVNSLNPQQQVVAKEMMAKGQDPRTAGLNTAAGSAAAPFRGLTTEQQNQASVLEQAKSRVPQLANESDAEYNQRLQQEVVKQNMDTYQTAYNPINSATRTADSANSLNAQLEQAATSGKNVSETNWIKLNAERPELIKNMPVTEVYQKGQGYAKTAKAGDIIEYGSDKYRVITPNVHKKAGTNWKGSTLHNDGIRVQKADGTIIEILN